MNETAVREPVLIYTTWPDAGAAEAAGRALVAGRLAACVNIGSPVMSIYQWEGEMQEGREHPMLIKTVKAHVDAVAVVVKRLHPDEIPAVVAVPVAGGSAAFLQWIVAQTSAAEWGGTHEHG